MTYFYVTPSVEILTMPVPFPLSILSFIEVLLICPDINKASLKDVCNNPLSVVIILAVYDWISPLCFSLHV